jgi:multimeric flavodoxin WrbA
MARLLVIHHSPTRAVAGITESVLAGCHDEAIEDVEIVACRALDFATGSATADDILGADGYLLGTTANFGYMSGALKHVFDSTFLAIGGSLAPDGSAAPVGGSTTGRPFGLYVHGRYDTTGAVRSVMSVAGALGWRQAFDILEVMGNVEEDALARAYELGATLAAVVGDLTQRQAT